MEFVRFIDEMTSARLPMVKNLADFDFSASPVNEPLILDLVAGGIPESKCYFVLVGGVGTGKTRRTVAIVRSCTRKRTRGRCSIISTPSTAIDVRFSVPSDRACGGRLK